MLLSLNLEFAALHLEEHILLLEGPDRRLPAAQQELRLCEVLGQRERPRGNTCAERGRDLWH